MMIKGLFGNRNIERILLFLFVNERCYGTQLQTLLRVPLTPIQRGLAYLESEEVLTSHYEGKVRIYQFNPAYPLRWELEALLKKSYILLPAQEKRDYCFVHKEKLPAKKEWKRERSRKKELSLFWERLLKVEKLSLVTKSKVEEKGVVKEGKAAVTITLASPSILTFREKGHWLAGGFPQTAFSNIFRWSLDFRSGLITLEHLRHGIDRPVFLFHLTSNEPHRLESVGAHLCGQDTYFANVAWNDEKIIFRWRVIGLDKNDELIYHYS